MRTTTDIDPSSRAFRRLAWIFAGCLIVIQATLFITNLKREYQRTLDVEYARLADAARIADENISGSLRAVDSLVHDIVNETKRLGINHTDDLTKYMIARSQGVPESRTALITNSSGIIIATTRNLNLGLDVRDRPYFVRCNNTVCANHIYYSSLFEKTPTGAKVFFASHALVDPDGAWMGIIAVAIDARMFDDLLSSIRPDDSSSSVHLVGADGRVISRAPDPERYRGVDVSQMGHYAHHIATGQKVSFHRLVTVTDNIEKISAVRTIADGSYVVVVQTPVSSVLHLFHVQEVTDSIIFILLSVAILSMTWLAVRHKSREAIALRKTAAALDQLRISEEKYRGLIETQIDMVLRLDINGVFTFANETTCQVFGIKRDHLIGESWKRFVNPEDHHSTAEQITRALSPPFPRVRVQNRLRTHDGERWYSWEGIAVSGHNSPATEVQAVGRDITLRKASEKRVAELLDFNNKIITSCPIGILAYNSAGDCVLANDAMSELVGDSIDTLLSQNLWNLDSWRNAGLHDLCRDAMTGNVIIRRDVFFHSTFGRTFWADYYFVPFVSSGEVNLLTIINDVTSWHESEDKLSEARQRAEAADRAKSEFLAMMSHELRTPLNSILGFSELIRETQFIHTEDAKVIEYASYINTSGQHLLSILNDILDLAKIEAGRMNLDLSIIQLHPVFEDIHRLFAHKASQQGLTLSIDIPKISNYVLADERLIRQILFNLISNAIKFTVKGGVLLKLAPTLVNHNILDVHVDVIDTGIGIDFARQQDLFKPFTQLIQTANRRFEGTGLGLVITKRLVEMMGGQIGVESEPEKGSRFWFSIPLRIADAKDCPKPRDYNRVHHNSIRKLKILVAEDNHINQLLVISVLEKSGHDVTVVENGRAAVDAVTANEFDLVLMDIQMPEMDGQEAATLIRAMSSPKNNICIIALTADVIPEHKERYLASGFNAHVAKPIEANYLLEVIDSHMG